MAVPVYTVEIGWESALAGRFTLDRSQMGGADTLSSTFEDFFGATFSDVSEDADRFRIRRGRSDLLGPMRAGELELVLSDLDGDYNPLSSSSPLAALDPGFQPMRPVRVKSLLGATERTHFAGWIRRADFDPETRSCSIHAQDLFLWLERARPEITAGATTVGEAIGRVLDAIQWTEPTLRDLATGDTLGSTFEADGTKTALQLIAELLEFDRGVFYIRGDGTAVYEDRHARSSRRTPSVTLTDVLVTSSSAIDLDALVNRIRVAKTGGVEWVKADLTSIAAYGLSEGTPIASPYLQSDETAASLAAYLIEQLKDPQPPVAFEQDEPAQLDDLLGLELQDLVELDTGDLGAVGEYHLEQIEHEVNAPGFDHVVRCLASKRPPAVFQLDLSTLTSADSLTH